MPRRDGEVFFFGTAIVILEKSGALRRGFSAEGALIGEVCHDG
jgi:hypothetical protein